MSSILKSKIGKKLLFSILAASSLFAILVTIIQISFDYRQEMSALRHSLKQSKKSYATSLANAVWGDNIPELASILEGMANLNDIESIAILQPGGSEIIRHGKESSSAVMYDSFDLEHMKSGQNVVIASARLAVGLDRVYADLAKKLLVIFVTQGIVALAISAFILFIVFYYVTRHIAKITLFTSEIEYDSPSKQNFSVLRIDRDISKNRDEIDVLVDAINNMNFRLHKLYVGMEGEISSRTREIEEKNQSIQSIFQNIKLGIFTFGSSYKIDSQYSRELESLVHASDLSGKDIFTFLFNRSHFTGDALAQIKAVIEVCVGGSVHNFEANGHLLPAEIKYSANGSSQSILEIEWQPMIDENDNIAKMMVVLRDVTNFREIKRLAETQAEELKVIAEILLCGVLRTQDFFTASAERIRENFTLLSSGRKDFMTVKKLFRNAHTIKGHARSCAFSAIADCLHEAENDYAIMIDNEAKDWDHPLLSSRWESAAKVIKLYENLFIEKFAYQLAETKRAIDTTAIGMLQASMESGLSTINLRAEERGLDHPIVKFSQVGDGIIPTKTYRILGDTLMHLLNNSLAHGLESASERLIQGKAAAGTIAIDLLLLERSIKIIYRDDGRGLNLAELRRKAPLPGDSASDEDIAALIFQSGISTAKTVDIDAGRGIGMDAAAAFIAEIGGSLAIAFQGPTNDSGFRPFQFEIEFPKAEQRKSA